MRHVLGQVGVEPGVDGAGAGEFAGDFQADVLGDLGAGAVGADQEPGPLGEDGVRDPVVQGHCHAVGVLGVAEVFGVEGNLRAALGGVGDQHRLHQRLRHIEHGAGAALQVVTAPVVAGAPGLQPGDLGAAEAGGEQGVPHLLPRGGLQFGGLLDAQVPQDLHGPLVDDVRPGGVRHPVPLGHHVHPHPVGGQRQRGGAAHGTGSHDNDVGVEFARCVHDSFLPFYGCRFRKGGRGRAVGRVRAVRVRAGVQPVVGVCAFAYSSCRAASLRPQGPGSRSSETMEITEATSR